MNAVIPALLTLLLGTVQTPELRIETVGNAGVVLSDGATSLLVDLPFESGAFGYQRYDPDGLEPEGRVVSVVTHHHRDHFARELVLERPGWRVVGPESAVADLPSERVLAGDSVTVGRFTIVSLPSPHTRDHRSYRVRWQGRTLHFSGDTEDPSRVLSEEGLDLLFITPWLACSVIQPGHALPARRAILYHLRPDGSDPRCGPSERLSQGAVFTLSPDHP